VYVTCSAKARCETREKLQPSSPQTLNASYQEHTRLSTMIGKPFKPLTITRKPSSAEQHNARTTDATEPPAKRRRVSDRSDEDVLATHAAARVVSQAPKAPRKPFLPIVNPVAAAKGEVAISNGSEGYYTVLWCVPSGLSSAT